MTTTPKLTEESKALLIAICDAAPNWSGTPPCYEVLDAAKRGNLTHLKRAKLVATFKNDGEEWIEILPEGWRVKDAIAAPLPQPDAAPIMPAPAAKLPIVEQAIQDEREGNFNAAAEGFRLAGNEAASRTQADLCYAAARRCLAAADPTYEARRQKRLAQDAACGK